MWKYVSRRLKDTFERSVNHLEKRSAVGVVSSPSNVPEEQPKPVGACRWIISQKCWTSSQGNSGTKNNKWNFEQLNRTWIGAITWSSALVVGWYTSQLIHLKLKYHTKQETPCSAKKNILSPYIPCANPAYLESISKIEKLLGGLKPTVYLMSNDQHGGTKPVSSSGTSATDSEQADDLGDVLNSIENKLGLAAIENGQHQEGLQLLRSAANRNHAPALYNLGLCYEMGLGVSTDEKIAMELYRSAAALEHPGALYNLGVYYGQGRGGLARDVATGSRLLQLAATRGQPDAVAALAALAPAPAPATAHLHTPTFYATYPTQDPFIPTQSTLFVENVSFMFQNQNCEGTAY